MSEHAEVSEIFLRGESSLFSYEKLLWIWHGSKNAEQWVWVLTSRHNGYQIPLEHHTFKWHKNQPKIANSASYQKLVESGEGLKGRRQDCRSPVVRFWDRAHCLSACLPLLQCCSSSVVWVLAVGSVVDCG